MVQSSFQSRPNQVCSWQNVYFRVYVKVKSTCTLHKCMCGGRITLNHLDILYGDSWWNISIFCGVSHFELPRYFFVRLVVNFLDILSDFSQWFASTFCRESHGEYYRIFGGAPHSQLCYFVGYFTVNFLDIFSLVYAELSRYFGGTSQLNM